MISLLGVGGDSQKIGVVKGSYPPVNAPPPHASWGAQLSTKGAHYPSPNTAYTTQYSVICLAGLREMMARASRGWSSSSSGE